ncbi:hypothetical protein ACP8HI_20595 [Paenibacillus sp. FA6]|uniref:hypothetical protein n=1 Tax=Paenibacillus sp. FA6 TaxID=3413029 RepID=UPI003F658AD8
MTMIKRLAVLFLSFILVTLLPTSVLAAPFELTASAKTNFDKMTSSTNSTTATMMNNRYSNVLKLQQQGQDWDNKIKDLHYVNEEALILLKKKIQLIDSNKLTTLQTQLTQTRDRYKPLFSMQESLNLQKAAAKKLNNKDFYKLLLSQSESMKIAVQLARSDIRTKESLLTKAKTNTATTKKKLRGVLDGIAPLKVQIKAAKNAASTSQKKFTTETATFKQSIKNGSVNPTLKSLEALNTHAQKVIEHKQKVLSLEQQISETIKKVKTQVPSAG